MAGEIRLRMASFKESETRIYDENISKYSEKAVEVLHALYSICSIARRYLPVWGSSRADTLSNINVDLPDPVLRNMEKSLALEIREASKSLRTQEKDYYDRLKAYETGTVNHAIQLRQEDH